MEKLIVTPFSLEQIELFSKYEEIDMFIIGSHEFGLRQVSNFDISMIKKAREITKKQIFISVNKIMHNRELDDLKIYLEELEKIKIDGIVFSDIGVFRICKTNNIQLEMSFNTETTATNHYFTDFASENQIKIVELAKEITLEEIKEIAINKKSMISINIHGHIYMYQSVRKLLTNYTKYLDKKENLNKDYHLFDEERNCFYPLIENEQGTHLLSSVDICLINKLDKIFNQQIDFFKIDGFGYKEKDYMQIVLIYLEGIEAIKNSSYSTIKYELEDKIKKLVPHKKMGTGFLFKKTIY